MRALYQPFGPVVKEETIVNHLREAEAGRHISFALVSPEGAIEGHSFILFTAGPKPVFGIGLQEKVHGRGWGRRLMEVVLKEVDAQNAPLVTLTVVKLNGKARALYEKLGFVLKGEETFMEKNDSYSMERVRPDG